MRVMDQIPREVRQLQNDLSGDVGMSLCWDKNGPGEASSAVTNFPRRRRAPWASHDPRVDCHAQKLVEDRPGGVPGVRSRPLALEPLAAGGMKLRVTIGRSTHWYRRRALATFHGVVQGVAVGNIDECAAAAERRQGWDSPPLSLRAEQ